MARSRFVIRWDDVSPFQDRKKFRSLVDLFVKYHIPAVLGVIPDNRDETIKFDNLNETKYVEELKELEKAGWEIALHGYRHLKNTNKGGILNLNKASEFAGRTPDEQLTDLERGKKILTDYGFNTVTFIPPWHSYDLTTLMALSKTGFRLLSDGLFLYPRLLESLVQLPVLFWSVPNRLKMLDMLGSVYTICLHPHLITDNDINRLERFFAEQKPQVITASSLLEEAQELTKPGLRRKILESLFARKYKKQN
jgi:predicted deacetylase